MAQLPQKWPTERWKSIPMVSCQKEAEISAKIHFRDGVPFWPNIRPEVAWPPGTKSRKFRWAEKILGVEYRSASNFGTHWDKCFVGWNCAFLTLRQNERQVSRPTFWDTQETLGALPFIFCRLSANWYLSETLHTPGPVNSLVSICRYTIENEEQGSQSFLFV